MNGRQSDFEELRPLGEATRVPDDELSGRGNAGRSEGQRKEGLDSYPDRTRSTRSECSSCGASIPANRTKCRFCLSNHLDGTSDGSRTPDTEWTLLHVVHLLVEASTFYAAVAKGAAAATLLTKADRDPAVDDCQLIYDLDTKPAAQLTDKWPSLPEAVRVTSESGEQLLTTARERTGQMKSTQSSCEGAHTSFLYDEGGYDVSEESRLTGLIERAEIDVWLVPAIALQRSVDDEHSEDRRPNIPSKTRLDCRKCGRTTEHQFQEFESIPADEWSGQPMWECQVCQSPRHGPDPE
ncbi:biosurfactant protein 1 [Haloferax volcanii]|uniref:biosurfactant protein 1 n=1 Tax=Haloferax volcanii TaxID=2246 RepID=UPI00385AA028